MGNGVRWVLVLAVLVLGVARAGAQVPEKFTNLKVLPKGLSKQELVGVMRGWTGALGVRCGHCHTGGNPETLEGVDFASDAKWTKRTARAMARMVDAVNRKHLGRLEARPPADAPAAEVKVECVTCHRGLAVPETIGARLSRVLDREGPPAAVRTYRELREKYLTSGSYDFRQGPLNALGERLLGQHREGDALPLLEENALHYPDSSWLFYLLGEARLATGDRPGALEAFRRSLALAGGNNRARRRVEELEKNPETP